MDPGDDVVILNVIPQETEASPQVETTAEESSVTEAATNPDAAILQDASIQGNVLNEDATLAAQPARKTRSRKRKGSSGRKRKGSSAVADNNIGNDVGDSIGERSKLRRRACVGTRQPEPEQSASTASPKRNTRDRRAQGDTMENRRNGDGSTTGKENEEEENIDNSNEEENHDETMRDNDNNNSDDNAEDDNEEEDDNAEDDNEEEDDDNHEDRRQQSEEEEEAKDSEEENEESDEDEDEDEDSIEGFDKDDHEIIMEGQEMIDEGEHLPFDPDEFCSKNTVKQDEILTSGQLLLNINFLPLSFFIQACGGYLVCMCFFVPV